ncbi:hypothetical protein [Subtercola lobariae]|nr:hypothetical protein [Subtercola lobariae]
MKHTQIVRQEPGASQESVWNYPRPPRAGRLAGITKTPSKMDL